MTRLCLMGLKFKSLISVDMRITQRATWTWTSTISMRLSKTKITTWLKIWAKMRNLINLKRKSWPIIKRVCPSIWPQFWGESLRQQAQLITSKKVWTRKGTTRERKFIGGTVGRPLKSQLMVKLMWGPCSDKSCSNSLPIWPQGVPEQEDSRIRLTLLKCQLWFWVEALQCLLTTI